MNLKLWLASKVIPSFLLKSELDKVALVTVNCLDQLIIQFAPQKLDAIQKKELILDGDMGERRKIMATAHNIRIKVLMDALGYEEALQIGRSALFKAGLKLGRDARERLGVGDSLEDLIMAARLLYKVLGIEFRINMEGEEISMVVNKCSLALYYLPETCRILSAADEGVVQGLNENIHLNFTQRMTEGPATCQACINLQKNVRRT